MSAPTAPLPFPASIRLTLSELFRAFVIISISGFGGALPWARRMIVEQRYWMTAEEFNAASAFVLARSADHNIYAAGITAITAIVGFGTRINPLWIFAAGGLLGLCGWL